MLALAHRPTYNISHSSLTKQSSMSLCKDCVKGMCPSPILRGPLTFATGVVHEGTAEGKYETINGIKCYVATPSVDYPKDTVLLFLTDVFGIDFINAQVSRFSRRMIR